MNDIPVVVFKERCKELFEQCCYEAEWCDKLDFPEEAIRLRGQALGINRLRHDLLPFDAGDQDKD